MMTRVHTNVDDRIAVTIGVHLESLNSALAGIDADSAADVHMKMRMLEWGLDRAMQSIERVLTVATENERATLQGSPQQGSWLMMIETMKFEPILTSREKRELTGEVFRNRELVDLDLSGADLRGACFEKSVLTRCSFAGADLRGARFLSCDLHSVDLADAVLGDNRFDGSTLVDPLGLTAATSKIVAHAGGTFQPGHASRR